MAVFPEEPSGVRDRGLLESALNRPAHSAHYEGADVYTQAATLLWGLVKAHAFVQGNKRSATVISFFFLERAGYRVEAPQKAVIEIVYAIDPGDATVEAVAAWFRKFTTKGTHE
jgi:death-on-curing protein